MEQELQHYKTYGGHSKLAQEWIKTYARGIRNQPLNLIRVVGQNFWSEMWDEILYDYTERLICTIAKVCEIVIVSGSPIEALEPFCTRMGIKHLEATQVAVENDAFTGDVVTNLAISDSKAKVVSRYRSEKPNEVS